MIYNLSHRLTKSYTIDVIILFGVALALHSYRLAENPLWLDETLIFLSGQSGWENLLYYSAIGPHPPFYYLLQWFTAGMGHWQTEWAWRWLSVLSGTLTIPLLYILMRRVTSRSSALISALLLTFAPMHLYFSQEARPYAFLILWATLSIFQLMRLQQNPKSFIQWAKFALISIVGFYSSYSYSFIIAGQLFYLAVILRHWWPSITTGCLVLLPASLPLLSTGGPMLNIVLENYAEKPSLTFIKMVQSLLAIEPLRYGTYWGNNGAPLLFGCLILIAFWQTINIDKQESTAPQQKITIYHAFQVILPPLIFFAICTPLLDIKLPLKDSKQFIVLFPSLFILVAVALDRLRHSRAAILPAVLICGLLFASDAQGIIQYWQTTKSPEGQVVRQIRAERQPADGFLMLHYSPGAAFSFYMPEQPYYVSPNQTGLEYQAYQKNEWLGEPRPLTDLLVEHPRFWVIHLHDLDREISQTLTEICRAEGEWHHGPFALLLFDCR